MLATYTLHHSELFEIEKQMKGNVIPAYITEQRLQSGSSNTSRSVNSSLQTEQSENAVERIPPEGANRPKTNSITTEKNAVAKEEREM